MIFLGIENPPLMHRLISDRLAKVLQWVDWCEGGKQRAGDRGCARIFDHRRQAAGDRKQASDCELHALANCPAVDFIAFETVPRNLL